MIRGSSAVRSVLLFVSLFFPCITQENLKSFELIAVEIRVPVLADRLLQPGGKLWIPSLGVAMVLEECMLRQWAMESRRTLGKLRYLRHVFLESAYTAEMMDSSVLTFFPSYPFLGVSLSATRGVLVRKR